MDAMPDWSSRIPAAIAKAEKLLDVEGVPRGFFLPAGNPDGALTATEVALAKALWDTEVLFEEGFKESWEPLGGSGKALIAFTEKVESL